MARILVSCCSTVDQGKPALACMYDGFVRALKEEGNQVFLINTLPFLPRPWNGSNEMYPTLDGSKLAAEVIAFAPEVVFAFNHSIPTPVLEVLQCPIVLWDADSIQFYNDKEVIHKNIGRYYFFCFSLYGIENAIQFGAAKNRIFFVPSATAVEAEKIDIKHNISFIGTMFQNSPALANFIEKYDVAEREKIMALVRQGYSNINNEYIVENRSAIEKYIPLSYLFSMYSPTKRINILNNVADLGLALYGEPNWLEMARFFPDIALSYRPGRVYSLRHNQDIYNASKLCLNISHTQVVNGYAWRVLDVMASNGCLLSDRSPGITDLLKGYIDIPMFDDADGARKLAQHLLQDESMRLDIVKASQRCIEEKGRWKHRFADMESILPVKLLATGAVGSVQEVEAKSFEISTLHMMMGLRHPQNWRGILHGLADRYGALRWLLSRRIIRGLVSLFRQRLSFQKG